ncbi:hypothetical protein [Hymenobacter cellulosivorans]|uniref:Outer membrane protein beta-barrel domain-containing protein n=1 Tax=Hymenobacter cellulosivorans TaxID=2932249 RepID=A0ABY4FFC5_9BACT|nr:hypothetical protein [Hymenobacter cellulosivorans]UOQ55389.1 hypothetical protein MUN80_11680 [Hymenobacter cellulosivorans]
MKSFVVALCGLLLGGPLVARAQSPQSGALRLPYRSPVSGDVVELSVDSVDYIKATALNEAVFKNFSGQVFASLGYAAAHYDGLNSLLRQAGFPQVDNGQFSYGGGGSVRFKRVVLGIEGVVYDSRRKQQNLQTELKSSNALNYLGYAFFNRKHTQSFTPTLGVTYASTDITLTELDPKSSTTAGSLLTGPAFARILHYRSTGLALGAHYEVYPFDAAVLKRCVVGLHLNYSPRIGKGHYYATDHKQGIAGPDLNPLLFSARAVFGFVF